MNPEIQALPLEEAVDLCSQAAKKEGLSVREEQLLNLLLSTCTVLETDGQYLRTNEVMSFLANLQKAIRTKDANFLTEESGLCVDRIVDVEEFVESRDYLNQKGHIRPAIKKSLIELFSNEHYIEAVLCLSGDTVVPLLDGSRPTIRELAETKKPDEKFWVYSLEHGRMVPAQARFPHKTGWDILWKVTFDDGSYVKTNARHEFQTTSGHKVQVQNMKPGDRIASLYLEKRPMSPKSGSEYYAFRENDSWQWVHRRVVEYKTGIVKLTSHSRHHKDKNPLNNDPSNLEWVKKAEHSRLHREESIKNISIYNSRPIHIRRKIARKNAKEGAEVAWDNAERRAAASERMRDRNLNGHARRAANGFWNSLKGAAEKKCRAIKQTEFNSKHHPRLRNDIATEDLIRIAPAIRTIAGLAKELSCSRNKVYSLIKEPGMEYQDFREHHMEPSERKRHRSNHVVAKIECLNVEEDVYCMTVDATGLFFIEVFDDPRGGDAPACVCSSNTGA